MCLQLSLLKWKILEKYIRPMLRLRRNQKTLQSHKAMLSDKAELISKSSLLFCISKQNYALWDESSFNQKTFESRLMRFNQNLIIKCLATEVALQTINLL